VDGGMTDARIIDGKALAARLREAVATDVAGLKAQGIVPGLAVVLVGEDPGSQIYVRSKHEQVRAVGMHGVERELPAETTQDALLTVVRDLNADPAVHGVLVQLPLPRHLDPEPVLAAVSPDKDVDGLHVVNAGRLASGFAGLVPCTPMGCMMLIREAIGPDLAGRRVVVLGRSNLVGKPMAQLLLQADCTVTQAHSRTADLPAVCREADILVAATGKPEMVRGDWIKPGAVVIDVGISRLPARDPEAAAAGKTRVVGDVCFEEASKVAGWITPVPGGVGPMTIAGLLYNTLLACRRQNGLGEPTLGI
jgi:methylenetetrahydrofolate dehydrogenase (NADP+)/methenyltetrahydrofolate cyclohydrolase